MLHTNTGIPSFAGDRYSSDEKGNMKYRVVEKNTRHALLAVPIVVELDLAKKGVKETNWYGLIVFNQSLTPQSLVSCFYEQRHDVQP
ncbi:MAG: hypothetical protein GXP08_11170 [Gammaproteobacteria bacterium]|nr:hypothetical protein [Gammaproteobacteria bacterium]